MLMDIRFPPSCYKDMGPVAQTLRLILPPPVTWKRVRVRGKNWLMIDTPNSEIGNITLAYTKSGFETLQIGVER